MICHLFLLFSLFLPFLVAPSRRSCISVRVLIDSSVLTQQTLIDQLTVLDLQVGRGSLLSRARSVDICHLQTLKFR